MRNLDLFVRKRGYKLRKDPPVHSERMQMFTRLGPACVHCRCSPLLALAWLGLGLALPGHSMYTRVRAPCPCVRVLAAGRLVGGGGVRARVRACCARHVRVRELCFHLA